jgi:tetratricopeptide (TPR) repeat protein
MLAYLRLSRYDSHQFGRFLPRLLELAPELDSGLREEIAAAIEKVWEMYYPLGEDLDLANRIGGLLYAIDHHVGALSYFERSMAIYGPDTGTLYNIGACLHCLGDDAAAAAVLGKVLEYDPANEDARRLLDGCESPHTARAAG